MKLPGALAQLKQAIAAVANNASLRALSDVKDADYREMLIVSAVGLGEEIRADMVATFSAAGLHSQSGTMLQALRTMTIQPKTRGGFVGLEIAMKGGISYPGGEGNVYAAAGAFKYGRHKGGKRVKIEGTKARKWVGRATVTAARPGFMELQAAQRAKLTNELAERFRAKLIARGIKVN